MALAAIMPGADDYNKNIWEDRSAYIHSLGIMGKKSAVTIADFMDSADDFVENRSPGQKVG